MLYALVIALCSAVQSVPQQVHLESTVEHQMQPVVAVLRVFPEGDAAESRPSAAAMFVGTSAIYAVAAGSKGVPGNTPGQNLVTSVQDPNHPGEPWVVTTFRRSNESMEAFIRRHRAMVDAVRDALSE